MKKILIIEDDLSIAELERDYLEIAGFSVDIALDGRRGLESIKKNDFQLILLDLMLPEINGLDLCAQIRRIKDIPILMVTAKNDDLDKVKAFGLGADDYIVKPFSPRELVARVQAHITRYERWNQKNEPDDMIQIRELSIQRASRKVYIGDKEVFLTVREFDLLVFLAIHPNIVFSKEDLFERIWGLDAMGDTATVTVHVKKIREKVESDPAHPQFIETVWGAGYRFRG
ncbi:DNA-binding response OmpR family regulator [Pullulanibacillus pueri]|uniref:DNA-binding response regulator n=1 Tax=Pullulanibacillus pueri TaxID=1437324 RepID=A0A8J3EL52_9BACL|nr:response regulator transcription factor [Pullulanibacillus pueri]MBM7681564.1 DNA-binding response OmpR family regulator [Pullulanibacillus pueri]GGH79650.1 DNA-binding response regulator [Pullulanibacillus pueri]